MDAKKKIDQLRHLALQDPTDHLTWYMLGRELIADAQHGEAAKALERCCSLKPDYTAAYRQWGDALRKAERPAEAAEVYRKGIEVAEKTGDLQAGKEMRVFLEKLG